MDSPNKPYMLILNKTLYSYTIGTAEDYLYLELNTSHSYKVISCHATYIEAANQLKEIQSCH